MSTATSPGPGLGRSVRRVKSARPRAAASVGHKRRKNVLLVPEQRHRASKVTVRFVHGAALASMRAKAGYAA